MRDLSVSIDRELLRGDVEDILGEVTEDELDMVMERAAKILRRHFWEHGAEILEKACEGVRK